MMINKNWKKQAIIKQKIKKRNWYKKNKYENEYNKKTSIEKKKWKIIIKEIDNLIRR